ncbi:MAG TPA: hypothetical protein VJT49_15550 [Amycolatopsis sp.]|uniref:hypothetical protein n=1 Tax=Amycolatopsis sp. TaxID=37632 RepID=UPI002B49AFB2|nr:hypothetical protein [Amycolatopsis sp.]HKS46493.1 hypothetical protein [Amycolatopsis sp.]
MAKKAKSVGDGGLTPQEATLMASGGQLGAAIRVSAHEAGGERPHKIVKQVLELHVCMGLNACVGHDVNVDRTRIAGAGQCATALHVCHGDNECRGQGGCGYLGDEYEQAIPGEQSCCQNGSCGSPINESRVASAGPFKGTGVWKLARKRFEQRMWRAGLPFGEPPGEGYPDDLVPPFETKREIPGDPVPAPRGAQQDPLPEYRGRA